MKAETESLSHDEKLKQAIRWMGPRWRLHPSHAPEKRERTDAELREAENRLKYGVYSEAKA